MKVASAIEGIEATRRPCFVPATRAWVWLSEYPVIRAAASASSRAAATSGGGSSPWRDSIGKLSASVASLAVRPASATASAISASSGL